MRILCLCLTVCISVSLSASVNRPLHSQCICVPDQWQGILASSEREFDLKGGRTGAMDNSLYVSYDFANKRFAMTDLKTNNKAIADYNKGYKYVIRNGHCEGIPTEEQMRQMCLPENADYLGEFRLGTDVPVDLWQFNGPFNVSMKTTVIQKNCIPVTEEVYMSKGSFVSIQSSLYLDVNIGLKEESVFVPPIDCVLNTFRNPHAAPRRQEKSKRVGSSGRHEEGPWSLMRMLKSDMADIQ
jgi:hypothetical protein